MASKPTRNGIYYNLADSPYVAEWNGYIFSFSSVSHKEKFEQKLGMKIDWLNDSMSRRFHFKIRMDIVAVLQLYMQCESRGFYIFDPTCNKLYESPEDILIITYDSFIRNNFWEL